MKPDANDVCTNDDEDRGEGPESVETREVPGPMPTPASCDVDATTSPSATARRWASEWRTSSARGDVVDGLGRRNRRDVDHQSTDRSTVPRSRVRRCARACPAVASGGRVRRCAAVVGDPRTSVVVGPDAPGSVARAHLLDQRVGAERGHRQPGQHARHPEVRRPPELRHVVRRTLAARSRSSPPRRASPPTPAPTRPSRRRPPGPRRSPAPRGRRPGGDDRGGHRAGPIDVPTTTDPPWAHSRGPQGAAQGHAAMRSVVAALLAVRTGLTRAGIGLPVGPVSARRTRRRPPATTALRPAGQAHHEAHDDARGRDRQRHPDQSLGRPGQRDHHVSGPAPAA